MSDAFNPKAEAVGGKVYATHAEAKAALEQTARHRRREQLAEWFVNKRVEHFPSMLVHPSILAKEAFEYANEFLKLSES